MQGILATVCDLGVNGLYAGLLAGALGGDQRLFQVSIEASAFQPVTIAAGGGGFQSQIDANGVLPRRKQSIDVDHDVEIPAPASVFIEAAGSKFVIRQAVAVPDFKVLLVEDDLAVFPDRSTDFEGHPAQAAPCAVRRPSSASATGAS